MDFCSAARHNPAAVGQLARLINIFCINLMNSQHQFLYPLDENPPQVLYSVCSQPVRKNVIIVQGRERPIFFCQFLRLVSHIMLASWCLADTPVQSKNTLLFHRAAWSLSCGYHLRHPQAEGGGLSERADLGLRPCLTRFREQELLMAVLLHLVTNAALRKVHYIGKGGGPAQLFLSSVWIRRPFKISQIFPTKPGWKRPCFCEKICFCQLQ